MTPAQERKELFAEFCSRFPHCKVGSLIAVVRAPEEPFKKLGQTVGTYLCAGNMPWDDRTTPNGIVVPDRDTALLFNVLSKFFYECMDFLPRQHVPSWNVPLNVRVKRDDGWIKGGSRPERATDYLHTDAWTGEDPHSIIMQLYVAGTTPDNCVHYYDPPDDMDEADFGHRANFAGTEALAGRCKRLDYVPRDGDIVLTHICTFHKSHLVPRQGDGFRVSIDSCFALERRVEDAFTHGRQYRGLRAGWDVVTGLFRTHMLDFPNRADEYVDAQQGRRQAVNCRVVER